MTRDYLRYYDLETYLFEDVHRRFHSEKSLDAFDLFSIIIWKANRAKSRLAFRLIRKSGSLEAAARHLTSAVYAAQTDKERLTIMMVDWQFYLPMASSILTVLWPETFTVYDTRVCDELGDFHKLKNLTNMEEIWVRYQSYCSPVADAFQGADSVRNKDRFLWGRSAAEQLLKDIANKFVVPDASLTKKAKPISSDS